MLSRQYVAQGIQINEHGSFRQGDDFHGPISVHNADAVSRLTVAPAAIYNSYEEGYAARCHPDTRVDFLQNVQSWAEAPASKCMFWLNGMAGTGKSTISRTVCELFSQRNQLGASFFFRRDERDRNNARLFFTTIATQLVAWDPSMRSFLSDAIETDPMIPGKSLKTQFDKLIFDPLEALSSNLTSPKVLIIVIDALDECERGDDAKTIIHLLIQMKHINNLLFKAFLTSRPELQIRLGFSKIGNEYEDFILQDIATQVISHDIAVYLQAEFAKIKTEYNSLVPENQKIDWAWPSQHVIHMLVERSVPLFIVAATICRFVADSNWSSPQDQLDKVLQYWNSLGSQINSLDATYGPILSQLLKGRDEAAQKRILAEFRQVIGPIVILEEPLSVPALAKLLGISEIAISSRLVSLHSVLRVPLVENLPVKMLHLSFRDWLVNKDREVKNPFQVDESETHEEIAVKCLEVLNSNDNLRKDLCGLGHPGSPRRNLDSDQINAAIPPHVRYSCLYWYEHLSKGLGVITDKHSCYRFLKDHLLHWFEAMSILGQLSQSIHIMTSFEELISANKKASNAHMAGHMADFLYDAYRFILTHFSLINETPLQAYSSAVAFTPHNSILRKTFADQISSWTPSAPSIDQEWSPCLLILEGHRREITSLAFSSVAGLLASGSLDGDVRIWDIRSGTHLQTLRSPQYYHVNFLAFSSDGKLLAVANKKFCPYELSTIFYNQHEISLFDSTTWHHRENLIKCDEVEDIVSMAFTLDNSSLVIQDGYRRYRCYDKDSGIQIGPMDVNKFKSKHESGFNMRVLLKYPDTFKKEYSEDLNLLATGSCNGTIRVWDVLMLTSAPISWFLQGIDPKAGFWQDLTQHKSATIESVALSSDGKLLAFMDRKEVHCKYWHDRALSYAIENNRGTSVSFSPSGHLLALHSGHSLLRLAYVRDFATETCDEVGVPKDLPAGYKYAIISPDFKTVAALHHGFRVWIYDIDTGSLTKLRKFCSGRRMPTTRMVFSPNGKILALADDESHLQLLYTESNILCEFSIRSPTQTVCICFSPDSKLVATSHIDRQLRIWNTSDATCPIIIRQSSFVPTSMVFSADNQLMALHAGCRVVVTNPYSDDPVAFINLMTAPTRLISFEGDTLRMDRGTLKVSAGKIRYDTYVDGSWLCYQGQKLFRFPHDYYPKCVAFHDNRLVIGHESGKVTTYEFDFTKGVTA